MNYTLKDVVITLKKNNLMGKAYAVDFLINRVNEESNFPAWCGGTLYEYFCRNYDYVSDIKDFEEKLTKLISVNFNSGMDKLKKYRRK